MPALVSDQTATNAPRRSLLKRSAVAPVLGCAHRGETQRTAKQVLVAKARCRYPGSWAPEPREASQACDTSHLAARPTSFGQGKRASGLRRPPFAPKWSSRPAPCGEARREVAHRDTPTMTTGEDIVAHRYNSLRDWEEAYSARPARYRQEIAQQGARNGGRFAEVAFLKNSELLHSRVRGGWFIAEG